MRQPEPFYRKQTQSYYVRIKGKFIPLGKDKKEAWAKYHAIMSDRQPVTPETPAAALIARFLAWASDNREAGTYKFYQDFLISFAEHIGPKKTVEELIPFDVVEWLKGVNGGDTYKNCAVRAVMRAFNWAAKLRLIKENPIKGVERPAAQHRNVYLEPAEWSRIMGRLKDRDPFKDFLIFLKETGCRPWEARRIRSRHFDKINCQIKFPVKESKGKKEERVIVLNDTALAMIQRLVLKYPGEEEILFRNRRGRPWTCYSLNCRCRTLRKKLSIKKLSPYAVRHTFCTDALMRGVDPVSVATLMGHKDTKMVFKIYQHLNLAKGHMRAALAIATGEQVPKAANRKEGVA